MSVTTVHVPQEIKKSVFEPTFYLLQETASKVLQENLSGIFIGPNRISKVMTSVQPPSRVHTNKQPVILASPILLDMLLENLSFILQEDAVSHILIEQSATGQVVRFR